MAHDAIERSLNAAGRTPGERLRDLEDALFCLMERLRNAETLAASTERWTSEVSRRRDVEIAELAGQVRDVARAALLLNPAAGGDTGPLPRVPHHHARPKRHCPDGWRVITGGMAAFLPIALGSPLLAWAMTGLHAVRVAARAHRSAMAASAALVALGGACGGSVAANISERPPQVPPTVAASRHAHRKHVQPAAAAPVAHHRKCHDRDQAQIWVTDSRERCRDTDAMRDQAPAVPQPTPPSPVPSPLPSTIAPPPSPAATPTANGTPTPAPSPSASSSGPANSPQASACCARSPGGGTMAA